jgi:hypothetical protein
MGVRTDTAINLTTGAASAQTSQVWGQGTRLGLLSTTDCWVLAGSNPTAAANTGVFVPAKNPTPTYIVIAVDGHKLAAISPGGAGNLTIAQAWGDG